MPYCRAQNPYAYNPPSIASARWGAEYVGNVEFRGKFSIHSHSIGRHVDIALMHVFSFDVQDQLKAHN